MKYRFHITGPDEPSQYQKLPWRVVRYEVRGEPGAETLSSTHTEFFEFKTLAEVVIFVSEKPTI